jgi:hypothetical protein
LLSRELAELAVCCVKLNEREGQASKEDEEAEKIWGLRKYGLVLTKSEIKPEKNYYMGGGEKQCY